MYLQPKKLFYKKTLKTKLLKLKISKKIKVQGTKLSFKKNINKKIKKYFSKINL